MCYHIGVAQGSLKTQEGGKSSLEILNIIRNTLVTFRIWDCIDILIVAFLFYRIMRLFHNTSGIQIFRGIILIFIVSQISGLLHLYVLNYLISSALQLGIIALVIVFQPDLRNMLEQLGRKGFKIGTIFKQDKSGDADLLRTAGLISEACNNMAQVKTGVLIVLQRQTQLGDIVATGTVLNAEVSVSLLENIFFHNSPLHDGAVILSGNRIIAAGCVLPLSKNENLSRELGTRHRAGVGVTESSDAISIIVSEETGSISVAEGGMLKRHLTAETLCRILENALTEADIRSEKVVRGILGKRRKKNA